MLEACVKELTSNQSRYYQNPRFGQLQSKAMEDTYLEQLQLLIERNVLQEVIAKADAEAAAKALARTQTESGGYR